MRPGNICLASFCIRYDLLFFKGRGGFNENQVIYRLLYGGSSQLLFIFLLLYTQPAGIQPTADGKYFLKFPEGFPGGAVVENLPASAGDTGSSPGLGRSHMPWSSWAREPQVLSLRVWSLCSATGEAAIVRGPRTVMKSGPRLPQLEKALAQKRRPNTAINK